MKINPIKLIIAVAIVLVYLLFIESINILIDALTKWSDVKIIIFIVPLLLAYMVWIVYKFLK